MPLQAGCWQCGVPDHTRLAAGAHLCGLHRGRGEPVRHPKGPPMLLVGYDCCLGPAVVPSQRLHSAPCAAALGVLWGCAPECASVGWAPLGAGRCVSRIFTALVVTQLLSLLQAGWGVARTHHTHSRPRPDVMLAGEVGQRAHAHRAKPAHTTTAHCAHLRTAHTAAHATPVCARPRASRSVSRARTEATTHLINACTHAISACCESALPTRCWRQPLAAEPHAHMR